MPNTTIVSQAIDWKPIFARGPDGNVIIPMGVGGVALFKPSTSLPPLVPAPADAKADFIPAPTTGTPKPSLEGGVSMKWVINDNGTYTLIHPTLGTIENLTLAGAKILASENDLPAPPSQVAGALDPTAGPTGGINGGGILGPVIPTTFPSTTQEQPMDLGNLFGQIISGVTQYQVAKASAPQVTNFAGPSLPEMAGNVVEYFTDDATGEAAVVAVKKPCKRRRRRRRLATQSDIRDLAALKAVLGDGQNLKTWIATHSS